MEPIWVRAPFLFPPSIRGLLFAPQCLVPYTQTRFASRRIRRGPKPNKPDRLASSPNERPSNLTKPPQKESRPKSTPAPAPILPPEEPAPKSTKESQRPRRIVESPGRKPAFEGLKYSGSDFGLNCYWNSVAPSEANLATANDFFTSPKTSAKFLIGVERFRDVPRSTVPEVAFLGRSNVGKSSLLNAVFAEHLAHTSGKPGRTRSMNFYGLGGIGNGGASLKTGPNRHLNIEGEGGLVVVDTPGYGFASREGWGTEVLKYLTGREQLRRVYLLVDASHGLKPADSQILKILHSSGVPYQIILSKADKVYVPDTRKMFAARRLSNKHIVKPHGKLEELHAMMNQIRETVGEENMYEMLACTGEVKINGRLLGIDSVRYSIMRSTIGVKEEGSGTTSLPPADVEKGVIRRMNATLKTDTPTTKRIPFANPDTVSI